MIEKIKKLLRLAGDKAATPAEAANALQRACQLAKKEGLTIDQIDPHDTDPATSGLHHDTAPIAAFGDAEKLALRLVQSQFPVEPFLNQVDGKQVLQFIGTRDGCQLASYTFTYLVRTMRAAWKEQTDRRLKRPGFLKGFASAISHQMPRVFKTLPESGLITSSDQYIANHLIPAGGKTKTVQPKVSGSGKSDASRRKGFQAGQSKGIRNALPGGTTNQTNTSTQPPNL